MIFGGVASERIQFNEKTLWSGGPGSAGYNFGNWASPRPDAIERVQRAINERTRLAPEEVAAALGQARAGYGSYQTFGDLTLTLPAVPTTIEQYRRQLDIAHAMARVEYVADGVRYVREYFASHPDRMVVVRLTADRPGSIAFTAAVTTPGGRTKTVTAGRGRITLAGTLTDNGLRFEAQIQVLAEGGTRMEGADGSVTVAGADRAVLILAAGTDYADRYPTYRGTDPHPRVSAAVDRAAGRPYGTLVAAHLHDHRELFGRVRLDIGQRMPDLPTDDLLRQYQSGHSTADRALEALFFQYGRYLLIASSRPGEPGATLPANLQGVWSQYEWAPWSADYHVNINLQMNYWPAEIANLSETTDPLFDFVDALRAPGAVTAREMFGNRGWVVHNETNPFGFTGVHDWPTAFWFPEAAAWVAQHYFEHYRFTLDRRFLRERAYPVMREVAQFWLDELVVDPRDGTLVVSPSYSPEHGDFSAGASMSQQIVWDLFTNVVEAAGVLGDERFGAEVAASLRRLDPGTRVGSWGQLQEWKVDWDDPTDTHRHVSHLFGLYPGRQISLAKTPEVARAAEVSLRARAGVGSDYSPGWSRAWKINFWARLLSGDLAHTTLVNQLQHSTLTNLWDTHPPFQIDGNFGATAGIVEMLVQSHVGEVHVLPALPGAWPEGRVTGLRARGDLTVDVRWSGGAARQITVTAGHAGPVRLRSTLFAGPYRFVDAASGRSVRAVRQGDRITFTAHAGSRYVATRT
jgi:alpha-L-fucosidase 2